MASWFEKRRIRRRKRERMEEIIAWMVVPMLLVGLIWAGLEVRKQIAGTPLMDVILSTPFARLVAGAPAKEP